VEGREGEEKWEWHAMARWAWERAGWECARIHRGCEVRASRSINHLSSAPALEMAQRMSNVCAVSSSLRYDITTQRR